MAYWKQSFAAYTEFIYFKLQSGRDWNGDTWMPRCSGFKLFNSEWFIPKWQGLA